MDGGVEVMSLPRPTESWKEKDIKNLYEICDSAMKLLDNSPIVSQDFRKCLHKGRKAIIEQIMELIMDERYFKSFMLYWEDAPGCLVKFLKNLEAVFTGNSEIKIRKNIVSPYGGLETLAAANVSLPQHTDWGGGDMKDLYNRCQNAMKFLDNSSIISENYRQCLQRGRYAIIENMKEFIVNTGDLRVQFGSGLHNKLDWKDDPLAFVRFLKHLEPVFTGDEEVKIRQKRAL